MKKYVIFIIILISMTLLTGCPPANTTATYQIIASHEVNSYGGSNTQVEIYKGMEGVAGASVMLNGQPLDEQEFFVTYYTGTDLFTTLGQPAVLSITIDGEEIINVSLNVPDALPVITACPDPFKVSVDNVISWTGPTNVDAHELYISWGSTQSGEDYAPRITPASPVDHTVPMNTVAYDPDFDFFTLDVNAINETTLTGEKIKGGSTYKVYTNDWEMPDTLP